MQNNFIHSEIPDTKTSNLNIKKQIVSKLPFLDFLRSNNENLQTSVFDKKAYTGVPINYFSFFPDSHKYG